MRFPFLDLHAQRVGYLASNAIFMDSGIGDMHEVAAGREAAELASVFVNGTGDDAADDRAAAIEDDLSFPRWGWLDGARQRRTENEGGERRLAAAPGGEEGVWLRPSRVETAGRRQLSGSAAPSWWRVAKWISSIRSWRCW
jgi:alkylhydroperoxidase family enzyme